MSMNKKQALIGFKLFFAILALSALVTEIIVLASRDTFNAINFFSFFTVLSNLFAAIMLGVSGWFLLKKSRRTTQLDMWRGAATLYMLITGIVFAILLSGYDPRTLTAVPWDNTVLHYIMPVVLLLDWLIDPPQQKIAFKRALVWLLFPLAYLAYSLIRGGFVGWYPYPFLNPATNGYGAIVIAALGIAATAIILTFALTKVRRLTVKK